MRRSCPLVPHRSKARAGAGRDGRPCRGRAAAAPSRRRGDRPAAAVATAPAWGRSSARGSSRRWASWCGSAARVGSRSRTSWRARASRGVRSTSSSTTARTASWRPSSGRRARSESVLPAYEAGGRWRERRGGRPGGGAARSSTPSRRSAICASSARSAPARRRWSAARTWSGARRRSPRGPPRDAGRPAPGPAVAEGVVGAVLAILHSRLLERRPSRCSGC